MPVNKPARLTEFFDQLTEPKPICGNCEYFDGGGMRPDGTWLYRQGDCHNSHSSNRWTTSHDETCKGFWPCSTRWPDCDHD
jgi:hypothetical protein